MSENKVNGPEDAVVNGIKTLPWQDLHSYEMFSRTLLGPDGTKFVDDRETGVSPKPFAKKKKIRNNRATALTSVMSKWHASCVILSGKKRT